MAKTLKKSHRYVQDGLHALGYHPGLSDGKWQDVTQEHILALLNEGPGQIMGDCRQLQLGLRDMGYLGAHQFTSAYDDATVAALAAAAADYPDFKAV